MASVSGTPSAIRPRSVSKRGKSRGLICGALLVCGILAGSAWAIISTIATMQTVATSLSGDGRRGGMETALNLKPVARTVRSERDIRLTKFSRLSPPTQDEIRQRQLTAEAIRTAHQRKISVVLAAAVKAEKAKAAMLEAAFARAERSVAQERAITGQPVLVTALAEDVSPRKDELAKPFELVMATPEAGKDQLLPETVPLPETRPALARVAVEEEPVEEKPVARRTREKTKESREVAYAKPDRSLFGDLFKGGGDGNHGKGTKVAIYDVSAATVHMPDGTKLRAHSGIGKMRDNPQYSHVKMNGPTPAGIYRLKMREKRFHGVEAIRMTSIDGTDPKNRTGLLTHTNLLRGQIGSHGCVAFQNYTPFLNAFKRGHVTMLIVVDRMPASRTQVAALYRKAGA
jgi:hypothetical protein